jgi:hypothetical protein
MGLRAVNLTCGPHGRTLCELSPALLVHQRSIGTGIWLIRKASSPSRWRSCKWSCGKSRKKIAVSKRAFCCKLRLSDTIEARLNEVRERMNELLPVQQSVGPLEEVIGQLALTWQLARPSREQDQCSSGLTSIDVGSLVQDQYSDGFSSTGVASPVHGQYIVGLFSVDVAQQVQKQCTFCLASDDMPPLVDEEHSLPNWCAAAGISEEERELESADMEAMPLGTDDDISQLFDWSCSGFEEILASI